MNCSELFIIIIIDMKIEMLNDLKLSLISHADASINIYCKCLQIYFTTQLWIQSYTWKSAHSQIYNVTNRMISHDIKVEKREKKIIRQKENMNMKKSERHFFSLYLHTLSSIKLFDKRFGFFFIMIDIIRDGIFHKSKIYHSNSSGAKKNTQKWWQPTSHFMKNTIRNGNAGKRYRQKNVIELCR